MKETEAVAPENEQDSFLGAIVSAHYLALQLRLLARNRPLAQGDAAEFLAAALTEWANLAGGDIFDLDAPPLPIHPCGKH